MAEVAPYLHKFRATGDAFQHNSGSKVIKRNRQALSCLPCRQRKLKCTRQQPCETCVKRNDVASCVYSKPNLRTDPKAGVNQTKAHDRLRQLEEMVMQLVDASPPRNDVPTMRTPVSETDGTPRDGSFSTETSKYVGSTHWSAILENIQELKVTLANDTPSDGYYDDNKDIDPSETDILFGAHRSMPMPQILAQYLPSRNQVDRLMSVYFNAKYIGIPFIHTYHFQRLYEQFWRDPFSLPPHWISILFSICCMSARLLRITRHENPITESVEDSVTMFASASAHCLTVGGFRPRPFVIEALALYGQCVQLQSLESNQEAELVCAIIARLAYRMAYHRDPDNFPGRFTVFESEMRRRVWAMTRQFDLMSSFQLGIPPNISPGSWDTGPPRNLLDSDFGEESTVLPESRPENQPTKILYFIVKYRLMHNFSKVCTHAMSFQNSTEAEIMDLDSSLRATYATVPATLRIRTMSQSFADPPYLIMVRINCEFLYQKSLMVLHRKFMSQNHEYSTKVCIESATAIVTAFADIYKEFQPEGQLEQERWMLTSFVVNDYLLAAMVLCLAMSQWRKRNPQGVLDSDLEAKQRLETLRVSHEDCVKLAATSMESRKVSEALRVMLHQLDPNLHLSSLAERKTLPTHSSTTTNGTHTSHDQYNTTTTTSTVPISTDAHSTNPINLTHLSLLDQPPTTTTSTTSTFPSFPSDQPSNPFIPYLTSPDTTDWASLDQYLMNIQAYDPTSKTFNTSTSSSTSYYDFSLEDSTGNPTNAFNTFTDPTTSQYIQTGTNTGSSGGLAMGTSASQLLFPTEGDSTNGHNINGNTIRNGTRNGMHGSGADTMMATATTDGSATDWESTPMHFLGGQGRNVVGKWGIGRGWSEEGGAAEGG